MLRLEHNALGQALLLIPDSRGKVHRYRACRRPNEVVLTRLDTGDIYHVRADPALVDRWTCNCRSQRFRKQPGYCKHIEHVRELLIWLVLFEENAHYEQHHPPRSA